MTRKRSRQRKRRGGKRGGGRRRVRKGGRKPGAKQRRRRSRRGGSFFVHGYSNINPLRMLTKPLMASIRLKKAWTRDPAKRDNFLRNLSNVGTAVSQLRKMK